MTHDHAVALSLLPSLPRAGLVRAAAGRRSHSRRAGRAPAGAGARRPRGRGAREASTPWRGTIRRFPRTSARCPTCRPLLWYRGTLDCAGRAGGGDRRRARRLDRCARSGAAARRRRGRARRHRDQRAGARRGFGGASRRAHHGPHRRGAGRRRGRRVSGRARRSRRSEVAAAGVVLSEYPPGTPALPYHFPLRNRIISGLARVVVVVEAAEKSGSLITAACALEQGREVMAVPGCVLTGRNRGGHALHSRRRKDCRDSGRYRG